MLSKQLHTSCKIIFIFKNVIFRLSPHLISWQENRCFSFSISSKSSKLTNYTYNAFQNDATFRKKKRVLNFRCKTVFLPFAFSQVLQYKLIKLKLKVKEVSKVFSRTDFSYVYNEFSNLEIYGVCFQITNSKS